MDRAVYSILPLIAFIISFAMCLGIIYISNKHNLFVDSKNSKKPQKIHDVSTSRAGGLGIFCASLLVVVCYFPFGFYFIAAGFITFMGGITEDFKGTLSPKVRLLIQMLSAIAGMALLNALILDVGIHFIFPLWLGVLFTIFAVVGSINTINIIDGFNGLASGISIMVLSSLSICAYMVGDTQIFHISIIILCAIFGFFVLNFPKGKIFLGDGGAYFLGFCIVEIAILLSQKYEQVSPWFVLCIMIYPIYEVLFSSYRRKKRGLPAMSPDKMHLHSIIFRKITKNNYKTSIVVWIFVLPFIYAPLFYMGNAKLLLASIFLFICSYHLLYFKIIKPHKKRKS